MSRRTVMTGYLGPCDGRRRERGVYVCIPDHVGPSDAPAVIPILAGLIRAGDRLLYSQERSLAHRLAVERFAADLGVDSAPLQEQAHSPRLVIVILDPFADSDSAIRARAHARGPSDVVIAELLATHAEATPELSPKNAPF
ncbi:hypothetical protein OVA26_16450 [Microbacterium sp. SL62]|uniref:hypothetical protein n=1 Tax=Microbacterium sp. SL62 TaxID=2995139 RepID=UPI002276BC09|nr:hypothetical protein [Microbacterium sp. SL62]MCY1718528.1 hypothetical protein [Microbacterium sp. SL62]